ncbi:MAG: ferredoxin [Shimia sp.]|uniref:ferredoxin n=1 Tax=Shimia sp. TaxID=1954381 RepID=UPI0040583786
MASTAPPSLNAIADAAHARGLLMMGATATDDAYGDTTVLLGTGAAFWGVFSQAPEYLDGLANPVDRWSKRIVGDIAQTFGATTSFPSDGPPYPPFIAWALASGRFHQSPVGMMVHDTVGLMISLRGALHIPHKITLPDDHAPTPCTACAAPCTTACPVSALSASEPYNLKACHDFLATPDGVDCMRGGCLARRACPLSSGAARTDAQSALHMKAFHP